MFLCIINIFRRLIRRMQHRKRNNIRRLSRNNIDRTTNSTDKLINIDRLINSTDRPATDRTATDRPAIDRPATDKPATNKTAIDRPATDKPATDKTATDRPATDKPATDRPATDRPVTDKTATDKTATNKPATNKPATNKPATDRTSTDRPATDIIRLSRNNDSHYNDRPTFFYKQKYPIRAGGILFYRIKNKKYEYLVVKTNDTYSDLGGKTEICDRDIYDTISREVKEESNSYFIQNSIYSLLVDNINKSKYLVKAKYLLFILESHIDTDINNLDWIDKNTFIDNIHPRLIEIIDNL